MGQGTSVATATCRRDDDVTVVSFWLMHILSWDCPGGRWAAIKAPVPGRQRRVSLWGERPLWLGWVFLWTPSASEPAEQVPVPWPSWESNAHGIFILDCQDGKKCTSVIEATKSIIFCYKNLNTLTLYQSGKGKSIAQGDNTLHPQEWCDQPKEKISHSVDNVMWKKWIAHMSLVETESDIASVENSSQFA